MLILKRLLLGAATLILVETAAVTPAQAFTLSFQSTDGTLAGNLTSPDSGIGMSTLSITRPLGSFSGQLALLGMWVGTGENRWFQRSGMTSMVPAGSILSSTQLANSIPSGFPLSGFTLGRITSTLGVSLFCHSDTDCLGDSGGISLTGISFTDSSGMLSYSWPNYSVGITVTAWQATSTSPLTTLPNSGSNSTSTPTQSTNSVPEPSSAFALLLLGSGWLLRRKLAVG